MSATISYQDYWVNPRIKTAALWASMLFVYVYVDLFGLFRADVRADIEAGEMFVFTIGQGVLLGMTIYVLIPILMLFLSLVLPVKLTRTTNLVVPLLYAVTIVAGAIGEWNYYLLGSLVEVTLLAGVVYYAWTWPTTTDVVTAPADQSRDGTRGRLAP
ncbi:DUF6326 family protein [Georgenia sp. M64]|uniref:DUF6326 family protein n=1 Tax=Georgenia sp. M64 TaxID=3120520 RepID=UPI0030DFF263